MGSAVENCHFSFSYTLAYITNTIIPLQQYTHFRHFAGKKKRSHKFSLSLHHRAAECCYSLMVFSHFSETDGKGRGNPTYPTDETRSQVGKESAGCRVGCVDTTHGQYDSLHFSFINHLQLKLKEQTFHCYLVLLLCNYAVIVNMIQ